MQWRRSQMPLESDPWPVNSICCWAAKKETKTKQTNNTEQHVLREMTCGAHMIFRLNENHFQLPLKHVARPLSWSPESRCFVLASVKFYLTLLLSLAYTVGQSLSLLLALPLLLIPLAPTSLCGLSIASSV